MKDKRLVSDRGEGERRHTYGKPDSDGVRKTDREHPAFCALGEDIARNRHSRREPRKRPLAHKVSAGRKIWLYTSNSVYYSRVEEIAHRLGQTCNYQLFRKARILPGVPSVPYGSPIYTALTPTAILISSSSSCLRSAFSIVTPVSSRMRSEIVIPLSVGHGAFWEVGKVGLRRGAV